jgi:NAD(P)-dependent dehydrogenase (short-subunit alcohol dehydrogenase family)
MAYSHNDAVLITGCSSGIGRATAIYLAQHGYPVFATVRRDSDAAALSALQEPNLVPVCPLDLSHREHIPAVVDFVNTEIQSRGLKGLRALINNAGGGQIAPIELMDLDRFSQELQVRLVGATGLVQAFLPAIRQAPGGRLMWITTPALIPTPYVTSIHAADFAVNCLARTLQIELKPWAIPTVMIRCGGIQTPSVTRSTDQLYDDLQHWPDDRVTLYEERLRGWVHEMAAFDARRTPPEKVAEVVHRAVETDSPRGRYSVGYMASFAAVLESIPQPLADAILGRRF